jgi:hypothetical protein
MRSSQYIYKHCRSEEIREGRKKKKIERKREKIKLIWCCGTY